LSEKDLQTENAIWQRHHMGQSFGKIAAELNREGAPMPTGEPWSAKTAREIVRLMSGSAEIGGDDHQGVLFPKKEK
jgi:hypothetical protein